VASAVLRSKYVVCCVKIKGKNNLLSSLHSGETTDTIFHSFFFGTKDTDLLFLRTSKKDGFWYSTEDNQGTSWNIR